MTAPNVKILTVKMRGEHGSAKTEFLVAIGRLAKNLGMTIAFEEDGHNLAITSTAKQRVALFDFNRGGQPLEGFPAGSLQDLGVEP